MKSIHCFVSGKVQGVSYRAAAQRQALALNISGWVRNLADGRVELVAHGSIDAMEKFIAWLWEGPRLASVTDVTVTEAKITEKLEEFEIR